MMFDVETILGNADLYELVRRAGGEIDRAGRCACPLHGGDNTSGFSVYLKDGKQLWQCFSGSCGGGDAITFVEKWQELDFKNACGFLGGDVVSDPIKMMESAKRRHEEAVQRQREAEMQVEARRKELNQEELHLLYHETMKQWAREMWVSKGIPVDWQGFFYVGACDDKTIMFKGAEYRTPTLTIPIFNERREVLNIKHRLVNPPKPNDKYRPEREGLGAFPPLLAIPEYGHDGEVIWVLEGEIKAMVTCVTADTPDWQFIGVPGRNQYKSLATHLKGKNVIVVPDPGAEKDAMEFCRAVSGRWLMLPDKIDDWILRSGAGKNNLHVLAQQARRL